MDKKIWEEVCKAFAALGAKPDLLAIIGSRYDTLEDSDVYAELKAHNDGHGMEGISYFTSN